MASFSNSGAVWGFAVPLLIARGGLEPEGAAQVHDFDVRVQKLGGEIHRNFRRGGEQKLR